MEDFISKFGLTAICIIVMIAWFWQANKKFKSSVDENPFGDYEQPSTASVLGVLGTFIGIAAGLLNFDPSPAAMQSSVINLLGGMTTAFVTSIIGMGISLYFKNYQANAQKNFSRNNFVKPDSTIADLIQYLQRADAEKSSQIKRLEEVMQANNGNVIREVQGFGENFKQLNIAVGRLLEWQENYKTTVELVTENLQATFEGINSAKNSVAKIEESAAAITESSEQILNLIVTANMYEQKLRQVLSEIQSVSESTSQSVKDLTTSMYDAIDSANATTQKICATTNTALTKITDTTNQTIASMRKMSDDLNRESFKITSETAAKMEKMMEANDKNFRESLETLGKAMLQISKKFAEDYTPLTERLREIVKIAEQVRPSGRGGSLF